MIGITSTAKGKGLNKSPKTALSPTFQPPHLPSPCRANTKPPSPIGTSRSSHLSPETNTKTQNQLIYRNLKEYRCKPQNSPVWLVQGAAIYINIAAPCTTEIHTENQYFTLLVKPRVQPRFLHRLLILCFSCNPVIPKNKKSPKHFPFSVKISIFASVPRAERSNAAKPAQLPNRYRLPNFLLFKSYLPTDYKKTIVFAEKRRFMYRKKIPFDIDCGVKIAMEVIGGKWKSCIIQELDKDPKRPSELHRYFDDASPRVINQQLKELEIHGMIQKKIFSELPPHTEYSITEQGRTLLPIIEQLEKWGDGFRPQMKKILGMED